MGEDTINGGRRRLLHDHGVNQAEEEAEEAISLSDFALHEDDHHHHHHHAESTQLGTESPGPEFFGFLSDLTIDMCPADDIIFCGKLIPLEQRPLSLQTPKSCSSFDDNRQGKSSTLLSHLLFDDDQSGRRRSRGLRKRSESLSDLRSCCTNMTRSDSNSDSKKQALLRNSRSLDYRQLSHRGDMERNSSMKSVGKSEVSPKKAVKPRWYVFMFGMVKFPPEMELRDIKSRQFKRNPSVMFPTVEDGVKKFDGDRSSGKGSSWSLLKALSCKDHTSVAVTAPFCMPQA